MCRIELTEIQKNNTIKSEHMFDELLVFEGEQIMTNNLIELLTLILENDNPEQAVLTVDNIISDFLMQHESHQEENFVCQQANCRI